jgi:hypothetical protein
MAMRPSAPPPAGGMSAATEPLPATEADSNVTPEEQAMYEKFITNFHEVVFGQTGRQPGPNGEPSIFDTVMTSLTEIGDPVDALATTTVRVVAFLAESAEQAGKPIPPDVLLHAATEIIPNLAEFAEALGVHDDYTEEELSLVLERASLMYASELTQSGKIDQNAMKAEFDGFVTAEREGRLEEALPGITEAANRSGPPPEEPPQGMGQGMERRRG